MSGKARDCHSDFNHCLNPQVESSSAERSLKVEIVSTKYKQTAAIIPQTLIPLHHSKA